jgi:flagellar basal-body rod protein FlgB
MQAAPVRIDRFQRGIRAPLSIYLFQVASQKSEWLSARQTAVASNVANANTPGYRALDVLPFSAVLRTSPLAMAATNPGHMMPSLAPLDSIRQTEADPSEETLSGNTVNLEQQMINLGDVNRDFSMTANVRRAFHQLILSALK